MPVHAMACRAMTLPVEGGTARLHHGPCKGAPRAAEHTAGACHWQWTRRAHKIRRPGGFDTVAPRRVRRHRVQVGEPQHARAPADRRAAAMSQNFRLVVRASSGSIVKSLRIPLPPDGSSVCSQPAPTCQWAVGALTPHHWQRRATVERRCPPAERWSEAHVSRQRSY